MVKMKRLILKILIISILISIFSMCIPQNYSNAKSSIEYAKEMTSDVKTSIDTSQLKTIIERVIGAIQVVAGLFAVITIALTGFEYILCQTPNMKEELKRKMLPIIIAVVFIFGAVSIAQFLMAAFE